MPRPLVLGLAGVAPNPDERRFFAEAEYLFQIPRTAFHPRPKCACALVAFRLREPGDLPAVPSSEFFVRVVNACFLRRRKMVRNNLRPAFEPAQVEVALESAGLRPDARAQDLEMGDFAALCNALAALDGGGGADPGSAAAALPETLEEAQELGGGEAGGGWGGQDEDEVGALGGQGLQEAGGGGGAEADYAALALGFPETLRARETPAWVVEVADWEEALHRLRVVGAPAPRGAVKGPAIVRRYTFDVPGWVRDARQGERPLEPAPAPTTVLLHRAPASGRPRWLFPGAAELAGLGTTLLAARVDGRRSNDSYSDQSAELWSPDGRLVATSHQLVYYKA